MRFGRLDLNLLVALDALLHERSVSLAADRLHLSQSATSSALGRLREYFEDELLVLRGRQMELTPRAAELVEPVRAVLDQVRATIAIPQRFDPTVSDRTIKIMSSDYMVEVLLRRAILIFSEEAPNMCFEISFLGDDLVEELQRGRADILITVDAFVSTEHPMMHLFNDDFVVVGWSGNPHLKSGMTKELYERLGHVVVRFGRQRVPSFEEFALKSQAIERRIEVVAPTFTSVAGFLVQSERIATMHRRLAEQLAKTVPLKLAEPPFRSPGLRLSAQWATSSANDPAIAWVVGRLREIAAGPDF